mmetsp:Transcript_60791/g.131882  ORF Transcript_60791/g.131882 Transcript_60791/m.131882 type:complete len:230 (-) Transcript_60791:86-775(-)
MQSGRFSSMTGRMRIQLRLRWKRPCGGWWRAPPQATPSSSTTAGMALPLPTTTATKRMEKTSASSPLTITLQGSSETTTSSGNLWRLWVQACTLPACLIAVTAAPSSISPTCSRLTMDLSRLSRRAPQRRCRRTLSLISVRSSKSFRTIQQSVRLLCWRAAWLWPSWARRTGRSSAASCWEWPKVSSTGEGPILKTDLNVIHPVSFFFHQGGFSIAVPAKARASLASRG